MPPHSLFGELVSLMLTKSALPARYLNLVLTGSGEVISSGGPLNLFLDISPSAAVGKIGLNPLSGSTGQAWGCSRERLGARAGAAAEVPSAFPAREGRYRPAGPHQRLGGSPPRRARTEPSRARGWAGLAARSADIGAVVAAPPGCRGRSAPAPRSPRQLNGFAP